LAFGLERLALPGSKSRDFSTFAGRCPAFQYQTIHYLRVTKNQTIKSINTPHPFDVVIGLGRSDKNIRAARRKQIGIKLAYNRIRVQN
jgi:hypothetical protein